LDGFCIPGNAAAQDQQTSPLKYSAPSDIGSGSSGNGHNPSSQVYSTPTFHAGVGMATYLFEDETDQCILEVLLHVLNGLVLSDSRAPSLRNFKSMLNERKQPYDSEHSSLLQAPPHLVGKRNSSSGKGGGGGTIGDEAPPADGGGDHAASDMGQSRQFFKYLQILQFMLQACDTGGGGGGGGVNVGPPVVSSQQQQLGGMDRGRQPSSLSSVFFGLDSAAHHSLPEPPYTGATTTGFMKAGRDSLGLLFDTGRGGGGGGVVMAGVGAGGTTAAAGGASASATTLKEFNRRQKWLIVDIMSNMLDANIDVGLAMFLHGAAYAMEEELRVSFLRVLTNVLQRHRTIDDLIQPPEDAEGMVSSPNGLLLTYSDLVQNLAGVLLEPDLTLVTAMCDVATHATAETNHLASALVQLFVDCGEKPAFHLLNAAVQLEVSLSSDVTTIFRSSTMPSKLINAFTKQTGGEFLKQTLGPVLTKFVADQQSGGEPLEMAFNDTSMVVNKHGELVPGPKGQLLRKVVFHFLSAVLESADASPSGIKYLCFVIKHEVRKRFPEEAQRNPLAAVSGFLFLRYFCPAIAAPSQYGILDLPDGRHAMAPSVRRDLLLVTKILQHLANGSRFNNDSGEHVNNINMWMDLQQPLVHQFCAKMSAAAPEAAPPPEASPQLVVAHKKSSKGHRRHTPRRRSKNASADSSEGGGDGLLLLPVPDPDPDDQKGTSPFALTLTLDLIWTLILTLTLCLTLTPSRPSPPTLPLTQTLIQQIRPTAKTKNNFLNFTSSRKRYKPLPEPQP
jgi:hypothetical protein